MKETPTAADLDAIDRELPDDAYDGYVEAPMVRSDFRMPATGQRVPPKPCLEHYDKRRYDPNQP